MVLPQTLSKRIFLSATILFAVLTAITKVALDDAERTDYWLVVLLWVASGLACALAFAPPRQDWRRWWQNARAEKLEWLGVAAITLCAGLLRFYELGAVPNIIAGDEGLLGQAAMLTRTSPLANPFALFENVGALYLYAIRFCIEWFGRTPLALRMVPAILGTLSIPAIYLFARQLLGRRVAMLSAFLLAFSHAHIHFTRIVAVPYIVSVLFIPLEFYFLLSGLEKRSAFRVTLGGLLLGIHFEIYLGAQVAAVLFALVLIALVLTGRRNALRDAIPFWFGAVIMGLPGLVFAARHPDEFFARLNAGGTIQSGWLANEMTVTGQSAPVILLERVAHAFLVIVYHPTDDFYGAPAPLLTSISIMLLAVGIGIALARVRDGRCLILNLYFWSMPFAVGLFATPASADSYRMLIVLPAALTLTALGLRESLRAFRRLLPKRNLLHYAATGALLGAIIFLNLKTYFVDFAMTCRFGDTFDTRFASYLGQYVQSIGRASPVVLLSGEFVYGTNEAVDFFTDDLPMRNLAGSLDGFTPASNMTLIATPRRMDELRDWAQQHPGGTFDTLYDCGEPILLALRLP